MTVSPISLDTLILDSAAQPRTEIDWVLASEYAEAMIDGAKFPPIIVYCNGKNWLADGFHRVTAAKQAGLSELTADIRQGTRRDAILYSVGANAENGKRRTNEDKRRAVMTLLQDEEWGKWSNCEVARRCAVTEGFVRSLRTERSDEPRTYTTKHGTVATMHTANIGARQEEKHFVYDGVEHENGIMECGRCHQLYDGTKLEFCPYCAYTPQQIQEYVECKQSGVPNHVNVTLFSHKSKEYYTPKEYADAARTVMGKIDLDPASCDEAQKNIGAKKYYTEKDNGLVQEWRGKIWLNPPYSKTEGESNQAIWSHRLMTEYESGNVTQAILLVKAALGYKWFEELWDIAPAVCFARNRLSFILEDGTDEGQSKQGTAFFYFGENIEKFIEVFTRFGRVITKGKVYQCRES